MSIRERRGIDMGGRGTYALGKTVKQCYETIGHLSGLPILRPIAPLHGKLPEESHRSKGYILQDENGRFRMLRLYNRHHLLRWEIAYHPERMLDSTGEPILHIHTYPPNDFRNRTPARLLTELEYKRFNRFFGEDLRWTIKK